MCKHIYQDSDKNLYTRSDPFFEKEKNILKQTDITTPIIFFCLFSHISPIGLV